MKISLLIENLQKELNNNGDLDCYFIDEEGFEHLISETKLMIKIRGEVGLYQNTEEATKMMFEIGKNANECIFEKVYQIKV